MSENISNETNLINSETNNKNYLEMSYKHYLIQLMKQNGISTTDFNMSETEFSQKHGITKSNFILKAREFYTKKYIIHNVPASQIIDNPTTSSTVLQMEQYIGIVMRQTDLNEEEAKASLEKENGNFEAVIKNYLSDSNYYKREEKKQELSTNQKIYTELRNFMGTLE